MTAARQDRRVVLASHPVAWVMSRLARRTGAVVRVPGFGLVISDAVVAQDVFQRDDVFTKTGSGGFAAVITQVLGPRALGNMDGAEHLALRAKLRDVFAPERVCELMEGCRPLLTNLRDALTTGQAVDLVRFMRILSGRLTLDMMGAAPADRTEQAALDITALGERVASRMSLWPLSGGRLAVARAEAARLAEFAKAGYASDGTSETSLVRRLRTLGLSFEEATGLLTFFFLTGTLTTGAAMPRIAALLIDSGQISVLRERPDTISAAIDEGLRYVAPVPMTTRIAQRDSTVGSRRVRAGTRLVILTCNLARDPALFSDPDRFDITRQHDPRARHLWYGAGPHFCLGFPFAQRQLHSVLEILAAPDSLQVVSRRPARGVLLPAYAELTVAMPSMSGRS